MKFERDDPLYVSTLRTTRCDASGSFSFKRVPDGVWYVTSGVKWQGASRIEGGSMMQRVDVRGGRLVKKAGEGEYPVSVHGFEDRHFLGRVDRPRVGQGPVVEHAFSW